MPRFAANITMLFTEHPFLDRFAAAADNGFEAVEFQFPYAEDPDVIAKAASSAGVSVVLFNLPAGNWDTGDRGLGALPGRENELESGFAKALEYAVTMGCPRLHVMSGVGPSTISQNVYHSTLASNLRRMAPHAVEAGVTLTIEPINNRDVPGYVLNHTEQAIGVVNAVDHEAVRLQFDFYHRQVMRGDLIAGLEEALPHIAHIQIANTPGRHEPDIGEINYAHVLNHLDALGYDGWVGCEYKPSDPNNTAKGLGWLERYR